MTNLPPLLHETLLAPQRPEPGTSSWEELLGTPFGGEVQRLLGEAPTAAQERFVKAAREGRDILFCVRTGGGKTVMVLIWILYRVWQQKQSASGETEKEKPRQPFHAVVLLPTNSLLYDLEERLRGLAADLGIPARIVAYTSAIPAEAEERRRIRGQAQEMHVVLLTPDMWKASLLRNWELGEQGHHENQEWASWLVAPDLLVLEEFDVLRGNALAALRLLLPIIRKVALRLRSSASQIILTSATASNAEELRKSLIPEGVVVEGRGRSGQLHILTLSRFQRQPHGWQDRLDDLLLACLQPPSPEAPGPRMLVIIDDRRVAEEVFQRLNLAERGFAILHGNLDLVRNRAVVERFKRSELRGLITTTIINRGIDVGDLNLLVLAGWPMGGVRDVVQSLGRVARRFNARGVVYHLLDRRRPQEEAFARDPQRLQALYHGTATPVTVPMDRHHALKLAVLAALQLGCRTRHELPSLVPSALWEWLPALVASLRAQGLIRYTPKELIPTLSASEQVHKMPLRGSQRRFEVVNAESGQRVGQIEVEQVARAGLPGDCLLLGGQYYEVVATTPSRVIVTPIGQPAARTQVVSDNRVEARLSLTVRGCQRLGGYTVQLCDVHQQLNPVEKVLKNLRTEVLVEKCPVSPTEKVYLSSSPVEGFTIRAEDPAGPATVQTLAYALLATAYVEPPPDLQVLMVEDQVMIADRPGSTGAALALYQQLPLLLPQVAQRLKSCSCQQAGCPSCVYLASPPTWRTDRPTIQRAVQLLQNASEPTGGGPRQAPSSSIQPGGGRESLPAASVAETASWRTLFGSPDGRREVEVVFADLHIGRADSRWSTALSLLAQLLRKYRVFAVYFAGDTVELRYAHEAAPPIAVQAEATAAQLAVGRGIVETAFDGFLAKLRWLDVLHQCVFVTGNHDTRLDLLPRAHGIAIQDHARLACRDFDAYVFHGHGLGLEAAVNHWGKGGAALRAVRKRLEGQPPPLIPRLRVADWLVLGHSSVSVCDSHARVVGLADWTGDLSNSIKASYVLVEAGHAEAPVRLGRWGRPLV